MNRPIYIIARLGPNEQNASYDEQDAVLRDFLTSATGVDYGYLAEDDGYGHFVRDTFRGYVVKPETMSIERDEQ